MSKLESVTFKLEMADKELLKEVCWARREGISSFVRRAIRMEFARLGYLSPEERRALGFSAEEPKNE